MPLDEEFGRPPSFDRQLGHMEGRLGSLETRVVQMETATAARMDRFETTILESLHGLTGKVDAMNAQIIASNGAWSFGAAALKIGIAVAAMCGTVLSAAAAYYAILRQR